MRYLQFAVLLTVASSALADADRRRTRTHDLAANGALAMSILPDEQVPMIQFLLSEAGAKDINAQQENGATPLHLAAIAGDNKELIEILLQFGASVNTADDNGATPLHYAAMWNENPDVIVALVEGGAAVNIPDNSGYTALHRVGAHQKNPDVLAALLDAGASAFVRNKYGDLPIDLIEKNTDLIDTSAFKRLQTATR